MYLSQNVQYFSNYKIYLSQIAQCLCLKLKKLLSMHRLVWVNVIYMMCKTESRNCLYQQIPQISLNLLKI